VQILVIALVILGFVAFVYQGIALSSRDASLSGAPAAVTVEERARP
jgi:hypothetical protein